MSARNDGGPVDVLAVMDDVYGLLAGPAAERLEQARAAVAELIAASELVVADADRARGSLNQGDWRLVLELWRQHAAPLRAALARCKGSQP